MSNNNYIQIILLLSVIYSISFSLCKKQSLTFPYKIYNPEINDKSTKEQIYMSLERNYFYTLFEIGNPPKTIPMFYHFNSSYLSFHSDLKFLYILESSYNPINSKSFRKMDNNITMEDILFYNEKELIIKNLSFIHEGKNIIENNNNNFYAYIGLQDFYSENRRKKILKPNFLYQLKELGLIDYISFSINQTSENEGFVNINLEPYEYAPELYSNDFKYITWVNGVESPLINKRAGEYLWSLAITLVHYKNKENTMKTVNIDRYEFNEEQYDALLNPAYGLIKAPYSFKKLIKKDFFNNFIKANICSISKVNKLEFFSCNSTFREKLKQEFPPIKFYHLDINYNFVLEFDDLFYEKYGILYFLICLDLEDYGESKFAQIAEWVLGKPFFKKYQFSFDVEKKSVIYYINKNENPLEEKTEKNISNDLNKEKNKNSNSYINKLLPFKNLFFISLAIFIIFTAFFCIFYALRRNAKKNTDENNDGIELKENLE